MKNVSLVRKIASSRIENLLDLAKQRTLEKTADSEILAKRYVKLARKISSHYKVGIPKELKYRVCRNCGNFLIPGINCSVRLASVHKYLVYRCDCGEERHIFYKKKSQKGSLLG